MSQILYEYASLFRITRFSREEIFSIETNLHQVESYKRTQRSIKMRKKLIGLKCSADNHERSVAEGLYFLHVKAGEHQSGRESSCSDLLFDMHH